MAQNEQHAVGDSKPLPRLLQFRIVHLVTRRCPVWIATRPYITDLSPLALANVFIRRGRTAEACKQQTLSVNWCWSLVLACYMAVHVCHCFILTFH